jgi:hypothetical protein
MSARTQLATGGSDPGVGLRAVASVRVVADDLAALYVRAAREQGWGWEQIAAALGVKAGALRRAYRGR